MFKLESVRFQMIPVWNTKTDLKTKSKTTPQNRTKKPQPTISKQTKRTRGTLTGED